jgi:hypothetical protein
MLKGAVLGDCLEAHSGRGGRGGRGGGHHTSAGVTSHHQKAACFLSLGLGVGGGRGRGGGGRSGFRPSEPPARPTDEQHGGEQPYHSRGDQRRRDNEFVLLKREKQQELP